MPTPSVLITGAGPVGLFLALRLAQFSIRVTVLESAPHILDAPRAMTHLPSVFPAFAQAGILADLEAAARCLVGLGVAFRRTADHSVVDAIPRVTDGRPGTLTVPQSTLARIVAEHLGRYPSAEVLWGHRVQRIDASEPGRVKVVARAGDGAEREFEAALLVGADGGRSTVRRLAGVAFEGETLPCQLVAADVFYPFFEYGWPDGNFMADPKNYGLVAPITADGLWRVSFGVPLDFDMANIEAVIPDKFEAMFPGPRPLEYRIDKLAPYKAQQLCATTFRKGRVLLAGDAAHLTNPYAGMGLGNGLLDASSLAEVLVSHLQRGAPERLLDAWAEARRDVFLKVVDPFSRGCFWALQDPDVDSLPVRHPMLKMKSAGPDAKPPVTTTDVTKLPGYVAA